MQVNLSLSPGYRVKISRASRMSDLADRAITALTAIGGSAAFLEILRRWLQRRQEKRQEQLQLDVRILEEGHALRQSLLAVQLCPAARQPTTPSRRHTGARYLPRSGVRVGRC